jgi:hypothetical protein
MLPRARRKACGERQFDMLDGPVGIRFPTKRPFDQILRIARGSGGHSRGNIGAVVAGQVGILGDWVALVVHDQTDRYKHTRNGHG